MKWLGEENFGLRIADFEFEIHAKASNVNG